MDYQAICAALEVPISSAFISQAPNTQLYFDNIIAIPPDPDKEYAMINIAFGNTTESAINSLLDRARGIIVIRIYTPKDIGGLRARQLSAIAKSVLSDLGKTRKTATGIFIRTQNIMGPSFSMNNESPHFFARIEAAWHATKSN
jgi:hypothetical protein